jgi:hypothetical protein
MTRPRPSRVARRAVACALVCNVACVPPAEPSGVWDVQRTPQRLGNCAMATPWTLDPRPGELAIGVRLDSLSAAPCALAIDSAFVNVQSQLVPVTRLPPSLHLGARSSIFVRLDFPFHHENAWNESDRHDFLQLDFRVEGAPASLNWPIGL